MSLFDEVMDEKWGPGERSQSFLRDGTTIIGHFHGVDENVPDPKDAIRAKIAILGKRMLVALDGRHKHGPGWGREEHAAIWHEMRKLREQQP